MSRGGAGGVAQVVCRPLRCCVQGHTQSAFAPDPRLWRQQMGFFGLLVSFVQNLSQLYMHAVIFSPLYFLCFLEMFAEMRALQHCSQRSLAPAYLSFIMQFFCGCCCLGNKLSLPLSSCLWWVRCVLSAPVCAWSPISAACLSGHSVHTPEGADHCFLELWCLAGWLKDPQIWIQVQE